MSITVGMSNPQAKHRVLRLTMGEADARLARTYWGERPRISYTAEALGDGRWLLTFRADPKGNVGHVQHLPRGTETYLSWSWAAPDPNHLPGLASIRERAHRGELLQWHDNGVLEIVVRGKVRKVSEVLRILRTPPAPVQPPAAPTVVGPEIGTASRRLGALRLAVNQAIDEMARQGLRVRVTQPGPAEPTAFTIEL